MGADRVLIASAAVSLPRSRGQYWLWRHVRRMSTWIMDMDVDVCRRGGEEERRVRGGDLSELMKEVGKGGKGLGEKRERG